MAKCTKGKCVGFKSYWAGEDVEKREFYCTVSRNVNWYSHDGEE